MADEITSTWEKGKDRIFYRKNNEIARWEYEDDIIASKTGQIIIGPVKRYYANGNLLAEENFVDNMENGLSIIYYESGAKKSEQSYMNDVQDGLTIWYRENGEIDSTELYENGKLINEVEPTLSKKTLSQEENIHEYSDEMRIHSGLLKDDYICATCYHFVSLNEMIKLLNDVFLQHMENKLAPDNYFGMKGATGALLKIFVESKIQKKEPKLIEKTFMEFDGPKSKFTCPQCGCAMVPTKTPRGKELLAKYNPEK